MSKKSARAKAKPAKKPVNPRLAKLATIFSVVFFAMFPILMGVYYLAMALGGFLYNNQERLAVSDFVRGLYGFDLPGQAETLMAQGFPEDVLRAYKMYGDTQYELDTPVFPLAYGAQPQEVKVVMDTFPAIRGVWTGSAPALAFSGPGASAQPEAATRIEDWKDSMTGRRIDVSPWVTYQVTVDQSALHTYLDGQASLDVTYAQPVGDKRDWRRETVPLTRLVRFYVLSPEELKLLHDQMPRPDNIRLPLMNPLNPVFWALILIGSGIWILSTLRKQSVQA